MTTLIGGRTPQELRKLVRTLRNGVAADLWYDAAEHGDEAGDCRIDNIKFAMSEAALVLERLAEEHAGDVTLVDRADAQGNRLKVTVDARVARLLGKEG